jgi:hypothetical protein
MYGCEEKPGRGTYIRNHCGQKVKHRRPADLPNLPEVRLPADLIESG